MRITKRPSGGRGEYEISETSAALTPRDLLDHVLVLDLGDGLRITTGVRLLDRNGKRRLRIDSAFGVEIHIHRQLAAALLMPCPVRGETAWGTGEPIMESDRYGISNIDLSRVDLAQGTAIVVPERLEIANSNRQGHIDCAERLRQVRMLWYRRGDLPAAIAALLAQHAQQVSSGGPLKQRTEETVAELQRAAAAHARTLGVAGSETCDALPLLINFLQQRTGAAPEPSATLKNVRQEIQDVPLLPQVQAQPVEKPPDEEPPSDHIELPPTATTTPVYPADTFPPFQKNDGGDASPERSGKDRQTGPRPLPQPRQYQPKARGAAVGRRTTEQQAPRREQADRSCPIEVRLRSRIGGSITVSLLPRRREGMPKEIEAAGAGPGPLFLNALHEAWYQDVVPADLCRVLRTGAAWHADRPGGRLQWSLSGRDLYVLRPHDELSGFVSTPRLVLGDQHVVLCTAELRPQVVALLQECCGTVPPSIEAEDGLPEGWTGFRNVVPIRPLAPSPLGDILDALRPSPDLEIVLRGGVRLQYVQWLAGYPPAIRLNGDVQHARQILIDGNPAVQAIDGTFTARGWDGIGEHTVVCDAMSKTYSIIEPEEGWEAWPARAFGRAAGAPAVCGALVATFSEGSQPQPPLMVPASNLVLIGRVPGQIFRCPARLDVRLPFCIAAAPFEPVWALPADPLHADKQTARVLLVGSPQLPLPPDRHLRGSGRAGPVYQWCAAILDCSRKGLMLEDNAQVALSVWRAYRDTARTIWRASR